MKLNNKFYRGGAAVLSALLATGCFMGNSSETGAVTQGFPYADATKEAGDVTLDGKVTLADAQAVLQMALKISEGTAETKEFADMNQDGKITLADARMVLRKALKIDMGIMSTWTQTEIADEKVVVSSTLKSFDLIKDVKEADYIFRGTIVDCKQYKIEWTDEKGEAWGPYTSSVLEVRVSSDYQGKSPASEDTLRVYYPYGLNELRDTEVLLKEGQEYVFVTNALDDDFVARREKENPDDKFYQERYADVYISGASYSVLPVVEDKVLMYRGYFENQASAMDKVLAKEELPSGVAADETKLGNWFIGMTTQDFDTEFVKLLK